MRNQITTAFQKSQNASDKEKQDAQTFIAAYDIMEGLYSTFCLPNEQVETNLLKAQYIAYVYGELFGAKTSSAVASAFQASEKKRYQSPKDESVEKAFGLEFVDNNHLVDRILEQLREMASAWDESIYYSPCTSFVQSSGCGKSRTVFEIAKKAFVFYVSFMPSASSGYPRRSLIADYLGQRLAAATVIQAAEKYRKFWLLAS